MPAYIVVDAAKYAAYTALSPAAIAANGGRFLVRGGQMAVLEGDWSPQRLVILEFADMDAAKAFYASPIYREAMMARAGGAILKMVAVAGI
jgi:uncharacterized protein (DUF1330 family)